MENRKEQRKKKIKNLSVQSTILFSYTLVSLVSTLFLGITLYQQYARETRSQMIANTELLAKQTVSSVEDYLRSMRGISDAMYYDIIKNTDFSKDNVDDELNLLYEAHRNDIISFALYGADGTLVGAAPTSIEKFTLDIKQQPWFYEAQQHVENIHFSLPHVQNLFDDSHVPYPWVISISRSVELNAHGKPKQGILLLDMNYHSIQEMLSEVNETNSQQYVYLVGSNGELIYHPNQLEINNGLRMENTLQNANLEDGIHEDVLNGSDRVVCVNTVSYTGWKLVSIIPASSFKGGLANSRYVLMLMITVTMLTVLLINRYVAGVISRPIIDLDDSIKDIEEGNKKEILIEGSKEVQHLAITLDSYIKQNELLMDEVVMEQEEKRKSEMDALQSQINPHFLYNTLDSIVWMIEEGGYDEAVFMITELASLFRISLSKGKTIISIKREIQHAKNYMNIQKARYKDTFETIFEIDDDINNYCTVKLVIQPILENAIYYGVSKEDGDGKIIIRGVKEGNDIYISVIDNGFGMDEETCENLLDEDVMNHHKKSHGSGVGLLNVHKRIQLRFGEQYGLKISSELDEGTNVTIHIPAIPYTQANQLALENMDFDSIEVEGVE